MDVSYARLAEGDVARTVEAPAGSLAHVDVDADGRILGVEVIGSGDWRDALAALAMTGRLRVSDSSPRLHA